MNHKWTLVYIGRDKLYILTEYQKAGEEWYQISQTKWAYIEGALETIKKSNDEWAKTEGRLRG